MKKQKIVILLIILASLIVFISTNSNQTKQNQQASIGGDFNLFDQNNKTVTLKDLKKKNSLLFFGFTNCPDVCPNALNLITATINKLPKNKQKKLNLVFITVDPERDTPEVLKEYLSDYHPNFIGLTGNKKQITQTLDNYKIFAKKAEISNHSNHAGHDNHYLMDHSSYIYFLDRKGNFKTHFTPVISIDKFAKQLLNLI